MDFLQSYWMDLIYAVLMAAVGVIGGWIGKGKHVQRQALLKNGVKR